MIPDSTIHDLLIIGGGVNGAGIAVDAAGRGLDVLMCEQNDLASGTSSASTKLIHGGLRYLENYEFRLVREALAEREVLLRNAPHIITPMRFQLPHRAHLRPRWMIQAGLFLYDSLSRRVTLPASRRLRFGADSPLVDSMPDGFEYADAWVDDARLVVLLAMLAREKGAGIRVRSRVVLAQEAQGLWHVTLEDTLMGVRQQVRARALVNAAGPWVEQVGRAALPGRSAERVRLVKGCHIVVPRLHPGEQAFLLQNADGRVVFVIPYEQDFSLIGTTDEDCAGDPAEARTSAAEIDYLVAITSECCRQKICAADVLHHFAGVGPLLASDEANASKVSRDYTLTLDRQGAPLLTVHGGKITTYRRLAENAMERLRAVFPSLSGSWTATAALPGGDFSSREALRRDLGEEFPWVPPLLLERWLGHYGTRTRVLLDKVRCMEDLGEDFGAGLHAREVQYLQAEEWARTAEDILWRRSKLGLRVTPLQVARLDAWLQGARG